MNASRGFVLSGALVLAVAAAVAAPPTISGVRRPATTGSESAAGSPALPAAAAQIADCLVYLVEDIQVPALEAGPLVKIDVREGDVVEQGQLLAQLDDSQPKIQKQAAEVERDAAIAKASDDIDVRFAEATLAFSTAEVQRLLAVERKSAGSISVPEIEKAKLARHRDELQIEKSKLDMKVAKMTADKHHADVQAADLSVARRQILAPITGEVATVYHETSEWVNAGEPVVQIVRMDRLRVEGFVAATELNVDEIAGKQVIVEVELARGRRERFSGAVTYISPLVTAGGKYRVRAEVQNRLASDEWLLRPGSAASMIILK
ncbi:MAG TPA: HlyD family efflux transporter periplasmic adaptor subunit [Pirellulaceae bacterium]|nr:HlyD family efflux transporter periplasmic adaptor subunit [Pirellulaceae bacterium]